jgi:hypothetical protein
MQHGHQEPAQRSWSPPAFVRRWGWSRALRHVLMRSPHLPPPRPLAATPAAGIATCSGGTSQLSAAVRFQSHRECQARHSGESRNGRSSQLIDHPRTEPGRLRRSRASVRTSPSRNGSHGGLGSRRPRACSMLHEHQRHAQRALPHGAFGTMEWAATRAVSDPDAFAASGPATVARSPTGNAMHVTRLKARPGMLRRRSATHQPSPVTVSDPAQACAPVPVGMQAKLPRRGRSDEPSDPARRAARRAARR